MREPKTLEIQTESGSIYHVTEETHTWMKVLAGDYEQEPLRTLMGKFYKWSGVTIGEPMTFMGRGLVAGTRWISTTPVKSVRELKED